MKLAIWTMAAALFTVSGCKKDEQRAAGNALAIVGFAIQRIPHPVAKMAGAAMVASGAATAVHAEFRSESE
jgi:hypothetical protein